MICLEGCDLATNIMGVVSHTGIVLYTEGRATEGAWLDNNVGVVSMIILHRGAGYVKLLCIIVYYIYTLTSGNVQ